MKSASKKKAEIKLECRACGEQRTLGEFRLFSTKPEVYMDFCSHCEHEKGTITLYRRYAAHGTPDIINAVFAAERAPELKRTDDQIRLLVKAKTKREPKTNEEFIEKELQRRELARRKLLYYTTTFRPDYKPGWVHQHIAAKLEQFVERVERGESPRLMIFMPPRHGKSIMASEDFPSWVIGKHPDWGFISSSYNVSLPMGFSRNIRDRLKEAEYQNIFPDANLRTDIQGAEEWKTTKGGGFIAAGVGGGITGKGAHIAVVDDPHKNQEEAQSEVMRQHAHAWFMSTLRTRLAPGGGILLIQTRWHDADLAGSLLTDEEKLKKAGVPEHEIENWEVIDFPAIAEEDEYLVPSTGLIERGAPPDGEEVRVLRRKGEALHPERYPLSELKKLKNSLAPSIWNALYQQNPAPDDGEFFKKSDFRYDVLVEEQWCLCRVLITVDYAISKQTRNDYTVIAVVALTANDDLYVLDILRGRWGTLEIVQNIVGAIERFKPEIFAGERGAIHAAIWPLVKAELEKKRLSVSVDETLVPVTDKETRARPLQARTQLHKLHFSYNAATRPVSFDEAEREMLRFPTGAHDDIVDALAWAGRLALNTSLPQNGTPQKKRESWKDKLNALASAGGTTHMAG